MFKKILLICCALTLGSCSGYFEADIEKAQEGLSEIQVKVGETYIEALDQYEKTKEGIEQGIQEAIEAKEKIEEKIDKAEKAYEAIKDFAE